jgi:CheY-like chemotaxis protein
VLVIDDNDDVRGLLERRLTDRGFHVETAASGTEGLRMARELQPVAVTLEVHMPDMDGWEVLSLLQDDDRISDDVNILMLTITDEKKRGYHLGADDFLTKPIDYEKLTGKLEKYRRSIDEGPVLVVDDDENTRDLVRRTLESEGHSVCEASNGREAVERFQTQAPSLIILDLMMPEMNGFEFLETMRGEERFDNVPVVVATAEKLGVEERRYLSEQVEETLEKGEYTRGELLSEVEERLEDACARRQDAGGQDAGEPSPVEADTGTVIAEEVPGEDDGTRLNSEAEADLRAALDESRDESTEEREAARVDGEEGDEKQDRAADEASEPPPVETDSKAFSEAVAEGETEEVEPEPTERTDAPVEKESPVEGKGPAPTEQEAAASTDAEATAPETATDAPAGEGASDGGADRNGRPLILLVEDNEHNYNMLSRRLQRRGYEIALATDGQEGLNKAESLHPALILMDINLPVLNGNEVTRRIRQFPEGGDMPIIALTAHAMSGDREEALEAGCDRHYPKPVELPALLEQIEELVGA